MLVSLFNTWSLKTKFSLSSHRKARRDVGVLSAVATSTNIALTYLHLEIIYKPWQSFRHRSKELCL